MKTKQKRWGVVGNAISRNIGKKVNLCLFIALGILLVIGCSSGDDDDPKSPDILLSGGKIAGTVTDTEGNAYPNTIVEAFNGSESKESVTGPTGEYSISTDGTGPYQVDIIAPLKSNITSSVPISANVSDSSTETVNFVIEPQPVTANLIVGNADILGELKNSDGEEPSGSERIYAANVFDPPFGQLTAVKAPDGHHIRLTEWKQAGGELMVRCNGNNADVNIQLEGLIPDGTYTFWLNFLNKKKKVGEPVNFQNDVVMTQPLGASSGTENIAIADNEGSLSVSVQHDNCVLTKETGLVLVVIYHINGNTFGPAHIPDPEEISQLLFYFQ